ncbi:pilus assembly protein PilZ [Sphingomonas spermidinifaciens]|uniref:Pilus assembly protein PilZ n=1 Tax=Sphingomonas spermidinifaciens TaxID=1141889 RepID=A0A2A4B4U2_9SPHN|nr:PilZ domain-containing protein [Sphingomonas spermidinifaciens]PCD02972.1 pilus assembly protein PilZ [Sphingomonas spermidinifaciens]
MGQAIERIFFDERAEHRDEVHLRARGFGPDARPLPLTIVNLSPHGLMARCDAAFEEGARLRVTLPVVGVIVAEVRWSLGGRIGCRFEQGIDRASYYEMLAAILRR